MGCRGTISTDLFAVCNRGKTIQMMKLGQAHILVFLTPGLTLSSHQHRNFVCLDWSGDYIPDKNSKAY